MAVKLLQTASGNNGVGSTTVAATFGSNTTAGSLYVIAVYYAGVSATTSSIADTEGGNSYTFIYKDHLNTITTGCIDFIFAPNVTGGSTNAITITFLASSQAAIIIREYSGLKPSPFDVKQLKDNNTTITPTSNATTYPDQDGELTIGMGGHTDGVAGHTFTAGSGYGNIVSQRDGEAGSQQVIMEDKIAGTGPQTATFTLSSSSGSAMVAVATFKSIYIPSNLNNYQFMKVGDGMSTTEKIR